MKDLYDDILDKSDNKKRRESYFDDFRDEINTQEKDRIKDKVTSLRNFIDIFQKRMEGYEYVSALDKITYTGKVLAGSDVIQKLVGLISPFAENTNLIGEVNKEEYYRKKHRIHSTANAILLTSMSVPPENYNTIMEMFKSTFVNIGNVTNSSKSLLRGQFITEERLDTAENDI